MGRLRADVADIRQVGFRLYAQLWLAALTLLAWRRVTAWSGALDRWVINRHWVAKRRLDAATDRIPPTPTTERTTP